MRGPARYGLWLTAATLACGCGPDPGPVGWIDARAAVVHCTSSGRDRMPPVLLGLPVPAPPTGLYARALDPMALDDLGFERDAVTCAMLLPPDTDGKDALGTLMAARVQAARTAVETSGFCACEAAAQLDAKPLLSQCTDRPSRPGCTVDEDALATVTSALEPVYAALAEARPPLLHWRLVGKLDRPGWFVRQQTSLLERHDGGSTVFVPGQAVPRRGNGALVRELLEVEDVVAVVRQNSGQALLVVREVGKTMVFDHFAYPAVGADVVPLLPYIDNASARRYRAMLGKPETTRKLRMEPGKGNLVEVDLSYLESIDEVLSEAAPVAGTRPMSSRELPSRRIEFIAAQAPFGKQGQQLDLRIELSSSGTEWASLLTTTPLGPSLSELELEPIEAFPPTGTKLPLLVAGTEFEQVVAYGLEALPALMAEVESRYPGSIQGDARNWSLSMPLSDMVGVVQPSAPFEGLRSAFAQRDFQVEVSVADDGSTLQATVAPK